MSDNNDIANFLDDEIIRIQKTTRKTWIAGVLIGIFMILYMNFILTMTRTFFDAENAALLISSYVQESAPEFLDETEKALKIKAPVVANQLSQTFLKIIPELRETAEFHLDYAANEMIPYISWEFQNIITEYIESNSESLKLLAENTDSKLFTETFISEVLDLFAQRLEVTMKDQYDGRDYIFVKDNSVLAVQAMNEYLEDLIDTNIDKLDRKSRLERKILATLTNKMITRNSELFSTK